ncbi:MAG: cytochrome C oxidase subunit IV family protein [Thermomicrobiales bacterium]|nr:cytochrome C oxidase subunit IV family protein [Thermomicrobiales bacterium]
MTDHAMHAPAEDHGQEHLSDATYIKIALLLVVITAVEVAIYYVDWFHTSGTLVPALAVLSLVKFITVISYYMHLKVDDPRYRYIFVCGLILAGLIVAALAALMRTHKIDYALRFITGA